MTESGKQERTFRGKFVAAGIAFLALVFLITFFFGRKGMVEIQRARKNQERLQEEIVLLEREKARLEREIAELESNPAAVELTAREKLWLVRPGEVVIVHSGR